MHTIEFRLLRPHRFHVVDLIVDGTGLLDLVREAELPYAVEEQRESAADFAPDPVPLLAGAYALLRADGRGWPSRHLLGEPGDGATDLWRDDETLLLTCPCGIDECWALVARVEVADTVVRWSDFRNVRRDWDLTGLGPFTFPRRQYEASLRATARAAREERAARRLSAAAAGRRPLWWPRSPAARRAAD
ncbi:hypothetical protein ACWY4P_42435 [Streptomyces sp. LZ34]